MLGGLQGRRSKSKRMARSAAVGERRWRRNGLVCALLLLLWFRLHRLRRRWCIDSRSMGYTMPPNSNMIVLWLRLRLRGSA